VKSFRTRYRVVCVDKSELYDGVKELLDTLQSSGITIGIASSKPNEMIIKILEHGGMRGYFPLISGIVSSDDHADKTTCIERALDVLGTAPGRVLMVGDRFYDAEGAQNAGVDFCAALYGGYAADDEFAPYPCVCGVQSPREIAEFVLG
ncbi:MAG: HAD hydrolase-like protein, partial [Oscillospiraceae bacterium]